MADDEDWEKRGREFLTPEVRAHFEKIGPSLVEADVTLARYSNRDKHFAAVYWLSQKDAERRRLETVRFRWILGVAIATLVAAIVGIIATIRN